MNEDHGDQLESQSGDGSDLILDSESLDSNYEAERSSAAASLEIDQDRGREQILADLDALKAPVDVDAVQQLLRELTPLLESEDALGRAILREAAIRAIKGKVSAPASMLDAALQIPPTSDSPGGSGPQRKVTIECPYRETDQGLVRLKPTHNGVEEIPLTTFKARIIGEVVRDDGLETNRLFEIEGNLNGRTTRLTVSGHKFPTMNWVTEELGPTAVILAGSGTRDHARVAIQLLSREVSSRTVYTHLGWRTINDQPYYLHADGAIGTNGTLSGVQVDVNEQLSRYTLPDPPSGDRLIRSIRASMKLLDGLLPDEVIFPVFSAIWRAATSSCDFSIHLAGSTGEGKSELAALAQQHWGAGMDARHLPANWSSTGNSLEVVAFSAKDSMLVVDDFAPDGSIHDVQRLHKEMGRLFRAQGNRSGRQRLRQDATLQDAKCPRGLILSTGEDLPRAQSIRARTAIIEVPAGSMDWNRLTDCQTDAASGIYAEAFAAYIRWLAGHHDEIQERRLHQLVTARERHAQSSSSHRRTSTIEAELTLGLELFLSFAEEAGALTPEVADRWMDQGTAAVRRSCLAQDGFLKTSNPARRFLELLRSSIAAGSAHLASKDGRKPQFPTAYGWRSRPTGGLGLGSEEWQPQGDRVGWIDYEDVYLDPDASFRVVQRMASMDGISIAPRTLWKRMRERGILASSDRNRGRNVVRRSLAGTRREVLHLKLETLLPQKTSRASQRLEEPAVSGLCPPDVMEGTATETSQGIDPANLVNPVSLSSAGTIGTVGTFPQPDQPENGHGGLTAPRVPSTNDSTPAPNDEIPDIYV